MTQKRARRPAPRLTVQTRGAVTEVNVSHPEPPLAQVLLMAALGTTDQAFVDGILAQLGNAAMHGGKLEAKALNSMLAMVKGIEPKDELESMLGAQMAAVHAATMTMAGRLNHADTLAQQDSAAAALTKLTRTFGHQLEALRRYRGGAEQTVKVMHQHVNVSGAGAVVGVKAEGGGGDDKS
ncbi:MAG: hypothetical protein FJX11_25610 [Alphaproteobacteria bacterium]|nr:hypothetical protein [Alphaproteobacteria bacterium]